MKEITITCVFFALVNLCNGQIAVNDTSFKEPLSEFGQENIGKPFGEFQAKSLTGKLYTNSTLEGKIFFANFWFSGCEPCIMEFDRLNKLYTSYKGNKKFELISFTFEKETTVKQFIKKYHLAFPIICLSEEEINKLNCHSGYPSNILIDTSGTIQYFLTGGAKEKKQSEKLFDTYILPKVKLMIGRFSP